MAPEIGIDCAGKASRRERSGSLYAAHRSLSISTIVDIVVPANVVDTRRHEQDDNGRINRVADGTVLEKTTGGEAMAKALGFLAFWVLLLTLLSTYTAIAVGWSAADRFMELTKALLSWQVIAGGALVGGAHTFGAAIIARLQQGRRNHS